MQKFAIIIQVINPRVRRYSHSEMEGLAESAGYSICGQVTQNLNHLNPKYYIGSGKVKQLKDFIYSFFYPSDSSLQVTISDNEDEFWSDMGEETDLMDMDESKNSSYDDNVEGILVVDDPSEFDTNSNNSSELLTNRELIVENDIDEESPESDLLDIEFPADLHTPKNLTVIFNNRLSYAQITTLSRELAVQVKDRDDIILEIFELNARTHEAKLQIELARMALQTNIMKKDFGAHLSEKQGRDFKGKGLKGWEPQMLAYRRRKKKIQQDLDQIARQRSQRRKKRSKMFNVGVVGYTNAGKSTFINTLAGTQLETADHEFTTVSPVSRKVTFPNFDSYGRWRGKEIIFTDSVGFIMDMSPMLIDAFLSTLEELQFSDLLLIFLDISDSAYEIELKLSTTLTILKRINAFDIPKLFVANKIDLLSEEERIEKLKILRQLYPDFHWSPISSKNKGSLEELNQSILQFKSNHT